MSRRKQMSPRRSPYKIGQYSSPYEDRPYRGGETDVYASDHVAPSFSRTPQIRQNKPDGNDCKQKIADLHASSQVIVEQYTKKLEAKCERLLADEITQKKADILIRKNQHLEQFKEKLKDHIKDQQVLCEKEGKLQQAKDSLDNLIQRGSLSSVDNAQIIKLKTDVQTLEYDVESLKATIATNAGRLTEQDPNLNVSSSGSACCIM